MCPPVLAAAIPMLTAGASAIGGAAATGLGAVGLGGAAAGAAGGIGLGTILQGAGLLTSVVGGIADAKAQAGVANQNAALAEQQAQDARIRGQIDESRSREEFASIAATQRAQFAAAGVSLDSPTALDIGVETMREAERDAHAVRYGAQSQARAYDAESSQYSTQARQQRRAGYISSADRILTTAPNIWPGLKKVAA